MVEAGFINQSEAAAASREESALGAIAVARPGNRYFADWVAAQLADFVGPRQPRPDRRHHPRPAHAGRGGSRDRRRDRPQRRQRRGQPGCAGRDVARWRGARDGRRSQLRREPVQPRDPGAAPAGLGVQAVRLSRRARGGVAPVRPFRRRPDPDRRLAAARLRRPLSGRHDPGRGTGAIDQHDRGAGDAARRRRQHRRRRPPARHRLAADARRQHRARHRRRESVGADLGLCAVRQWRHRGVALWHRRDPRQQGQLLVSPHRFGARPGRQPGIRRAT